MKATDFDLSRDIKFDISKGITSFKKSRLLIFSASSIGLLRQSLIDDLGIDKTRELFLKFGYQSGYADFQQMKRNYEFDNELELLASGPIIHTWEGIVHAKPTSIKMDRNTGEFYFTGIWTNSYEAEQYLAHNYKSNEPVCWSLMGYASGWCTAFWGEPLIAIEPVCRGKGDNRCEWEIKPANEWGNEGECYIKALENFWR